MNLVNAIIKMTVRVSNELLKSLDIMSYVFKYFTIIILLYQVKYE